MPNPFAFGGRITNPEHFVGREAEVGRIFGALETAHTGQLQHISIVGPRRIGKSSLLYHLTQVYTQRLRQPDKYHFVYVDLDNARCHSLPGLQHFILQELNLPRSNHISLADFQKTLEGFHEKRGQFIVLCLDEFEHLTKRREQFPSEVFEAWRSLGSNSCVAFVTASQTSLGTLIQQGNLTSTFHNIFRNLPLGNFTEAEAQTLLARNTDRAFTPEEKQKLFELTQHHPARLQIAAQLLYEAKSQPVVHWKTLAREYKQQVAQIEPVKPSSLPQTIFQQALSLPTSLGKFVLELLKNNTASDKTATILGWMIIFLLIAVPLGWINIEPIIQAVLSRGK